MQPDENGGIRDLVSILIQRTRISSKGRRLGETLNLSHTEKDAVHSPQLTLLLAGIPRDI